MSNISDDVKKSLDDAVHWIMCARSIHNFSYRDISKEILDVFFGTLDGSIDPSVVAQECRDACMQHAEETRIQWKNRKDESVLMATNCSYYYNEYTFESFVFDSEGKQIVSFKP
jgi:hypothetical protein